MELHWQLQDLGTLRSASHNHQWGCVQQLPQSTGVIRPAAGAAPGPCLTARQCSDGLNQLLMQIGDLESSNAELEDSNTRLEGTAAAAQQRIQELEQQLQEARAKVGLCDPSESAA